MKSRVAVCWIGFLAVFVFGTWLNLDFARSYGDRLACFNLQIDSEIYHKIASDIVLSGSISVPISHPPGFILFLAAIYKVWGVSILVPKIVFAFCISLSALLTVILGYLGFGRREGLLAGAIILLSPLLRAYSATLQYEVFVMTVLLMTVTLGMWGYKENSSARKNVLLILCGLSLTVTILSRETLIILIPILAFWAVVTWYRQRGVGGAIGLVLLLPVVGSLAWIAYQYHETGIVVPISTKGPVNFYIGNNPNASGTFNLVSSSIGEPKGIQFIVDNPGLFFELVGRKFLYFFGVLRDGWAAPEPLAAIFTRATAYLVPLDIWLILVRSSLLVLGAFSLLVVPSRDDRRSFVYGLWILIGAALLPHLLMISSVRFLIPVYPYVALLAATTCIAFLKHKRTKSVVSLAAILFGVTYVFDIHGGGKITLSPYDFEGFAMPWSSGSSGEVEKTRISPAAASNVAAAFLNEEYLPQGNFSLSFSVSSSEESAGAAAFLIDDRFVGCRMDFSSSSTPTKVTVPCFISRLSVVKPMFYVHGKAPIFLEDVGITFAVRGVQVPLKKPLFVEGWGDLEQDGSQRSFRWSTSRESGIVFDALVNDSTVAEFDVNPFGGVVTAYIFINGRPLKRQTFEAIPWNRVAIEIPGDFLESGRNLLQFRFPKTKRPCDASASSDCRTLALAVSNFTVRNR